MQGWRKTMEDAAIHKVNLQNKQFFSTGPGPSLFAIFDGHGSNEVAEFCRDHLESVLLKTESYQIGDYKQALCEACVKLDKLIKSPYGVKILPHYQDSNSKSS